MSIATSKHLVLLKNALLTLADSGSDGFEGLVGAMLGDVAGCTFRLAASGSQGGKDGAGESGAGNVSYEAKLYRGKLNKATIDNKATVTIAGTLLPDVWILAATSGATTQMADTLRGAFDKVGIALLVLDWPANDPLPPLALLCAMSRGAVINFLHAHSKEVSTLSGLEQALDAIVAHPAFAGRADRLRSTLVAPATGAPLAARAIHEKLRASFSDESLARQQFGQPLAPAADFPLGTVIRPVGTAISALFTERPTNELIVLVGDQGTGKSWAIAQAWLAQPLPPITLFVTASNTSSSAVAAPETWLATKLIEHSGEMLTDAALERWKQRLHRWSAHPAATPRLIVLIDGLNERARTDWVTWLGRLTRYLGPIGGRCIATTRARYFDRIKNQFAVRPRVIPIEDFSDAELDAILVDHAIAPSEIVLRVRRSLRNPRILGIAMKLLGSAQIGSARELSIDRLLFEYIRSQPTDHSSPGVFSRTLSDHAQVILQRLAAEVDQDRLVFDSVDHAGAPRYDLPKDLLPVVAERFFEPLPEDETLYRLSDDGLVHALGIAAIRDLQVAERNGRGVAERLAALIEPISALDRTAEVVFAAAMIASVDPRCSPPIRQALIARYVAQQNVDDDSYPAFVGIVRNAPDAALGALYDIDTADRHAQNKDWLVGALRNVRDDPNTWTIIVAHVDAWLRLYSLDPQHAAILSGTEEQKRRDALADAQEKIDARIAGLTPCERAFRDEKLRRDDTVETSKLCEDAFLIVAGLHLAPLAPALAAWAFARALNGGFRVPYRDYGFVVQFNRADWTETRASILREAACFTEDDASRAGKWALVYILRATAGPDDARRAALLAASLVDDRQRLGSWRLVEEYSRADPCNPGSERPDNVEATGETYAALNAKDLMVGQWATEKEHLLEDAKPALARFAPDRAIEVHRDLAEDLCRRPSEIATLALNWIGGATPLMQPATVDRLLARAAELSHPDDLEAASARDDWVVSQYLLLAGLSHLDGAAQLDVLRALPPHGPPLTQLDKVFRPARADLLEAALDNAIQSTEENRLLTVLAFALSPETALSGVALMRIRGLTSHSCPSIRGLAMQISTEHPDREQLRRFVDSGWTADAIDERDAFLERWHGSSMIIAAAQEGMLAPDEAIARICPERYGDAVSIIGDRAGLAVAARLSQAIAKVLAAELPLRPPAVEQDSVTDGMRRLSLADDDEELSLEQSMDRAGESADAYRVRQEEAWRSFRAFEDALDACGAGLIVQDVGDAAIDAAAAADIDVVERIAADILATQPSRLARLFNFGLRAARAVSAINPDLAVATFRHLSGAKPYVCISETIAEIPLEAWQVWRSAPGTALEALWADRLDGAGTDHEIAIEVLAASVAGRRGFIERYATTQEKAGEPAAIARGLMVFGFLDANAASDAAILQHADADGLIGQAAKAAAYAYDRNRWARHWYETLVAADLAEDFWRYSVLFGKIVDARFVLWAEDEGRGGELVRKFGWTLEKPTQRRIAAWRKKRRDKLFGGHVPRRIYL